MNSMTPETDAMEYFDAMCTPSRAVESDFARTLERERDEWRKKAVDLHVDLINERDDTRDFLREIFNLTQIGEPRPADLPMKALQAIAEMVNEQWKWQSK